VQKVWLHLVPKGPKTEALDLSYESLASRFHSDLYQVTNKGPGKMRAALLLSLFAASAAVSILDQDGFGVLSEDESGDELIVFDTDESTKQLTVKQAADAAKVVRGVYSNEAWTAAQKDLDSTTLCPKANGATSTNAWVKLFAHLCIKKVRRLGALPALCEHLIVARCSLFRLFQLKGTKPTHIENFKSAGMTVLSGIKAAILAALDKTGKAAIRQDKRHSNTYKCVRLMVLGVY
jgi:hypothetical protein